MSREEITIPGNETIEDKLQRAWKAERRFFHLRGISRLVVWVIAMIIVDLLFDWQILSRSGIWGWELMLLLAGNLGWIGWIVWREWLRFLKPYRPEIVALEVEARHPELSSLLISYIQLHDTAADKSSASQALLEAMRKQAILTARPMDFREIVDFRQLRNLFIFAVCAFVFFLGMNIGLPQHMAVLFRRLIGIDTSYPTRTQIASITGNVTVKQGSSIEIKAKAQGKLPELGQLRIRSRNDKTWRMLPMVRKDGDTYSRRVSEISDALVYCVELGDVKSAQFQILPVPSPEVISSRISLRYPDYMVEKGASERVASELNMEAPEGTRIHWDLRLKPPVAALRVTMDGKTFEAKIDPSGTRAMFDALATNAFKYAFLWTEKEHGFTYDDVQHEVRVEPDREPDVELVAPTTDGVATINKTIRIAARTTDDHGLAEAVLVYLLNGQPGGREKIRKLNGAADEIVYAWVPKKSIASLKAGDVVTYYVEVSDRKPPEGSHVSVSASRSLSIVSEEQYLEWWRNELNAQRDKVIQARGDEKRSADELKRLKAEEKNIPVDGGGR